jgi:hypothetical protein
MNSSSEVEEAERVELGCGFSLWSFAKFEKRNRFLFAP